MGLVPILGNHHTVINQLTHFPSFFLEPGPGGPAGPARLMLLAANAEPSSTTSKGRTAISIAEACDEAIAMGSMGVQ